MSPASVPVVTIDGPSSSGKGTISRLVAARVGWHLLDSGALYRLVALGGILKSLDPDDVEEHVAVARAMRVEFGSVGAGEGVDLAVFEEGFAFAGEVGDLEEEGVDVTFAGGGHEAAGVADDAVVGERGFEDGDDPAFFLDDVGAGLGDGAGPAFGEGVVLAGSESEAVDGLLEFVEEGVEDVDVLFEGEFAASPLLADGKLYVVSEEGTATVLRAGPKLEVLGTSAVGENRARRMLPAIIELLHEAGAEVVIEGIESAAEALIAIESGADHLQGFHLAAPSAQLPDEKLTRGILAELLRMRGAPRLAVVGSV